MRTLLQFSMDVDAANHSIQGGKIQKVMDSLFSLVQPESSYFTTVNGKRTGLIVFDLKDPSLIPRICEPLFEEFKAAITLSPVMNRDDLVKGLQSWQGVRKAA